MTVAAPPVGAAAPAPESGSAPRGARLRKALRSVPVNVVLAVVALLWLVPALGLVVTSLRSNQDYATSGWWRALVSNAGSLTVSGYRELFSSGGITDAIVTTIAITVPTTIAVVVLAALAGYALVFIEWPGRDYVFVAVVALMVVPLQMALIPIASLYGSIGLFGNILGVIIFHTAFGLPFAIFLMRNFYTGIPRDLLEAARIDGAGDRMIFTRIVLPLGWPAMASLAIFEFLWVWNDLLVALVFLASSSHVPLTINIFSQLRQFDNNIAIIGPASIISMIIPLAVFLAFQRYFVRGVLAGAVK